MSPQDYALLAIWQLQAACGVKPEDRRLPPANDQDSFDRDLEIIRKVMERT